jgi:hypothetical protein
MVSETMMRYCRYRLYLRMCVVLVALDLRLLAIQSDFFVDCQMLSVDIAHTLHIRLLLGTASKLVGTFLEDHTRALVSFEVLLSRVLNYEEGPTITATI